MHSKRAEEYNESRYMSKTFSIYAVPAKGCLTSLLLLLLAVSSGFAYSGEVSLSNVVGEPGDTVAMELFLSNNDSGVTAMHFPLHFDGTRIDLVDVSFDGSIVPSDFTTGYAVYSNGDSLNVFLSAPLPQFGDTLKTINDVSGLIATLLFEIDSAAQSGMVPVDSVYHELLFPGSGNWVWVHFSDGDGNLLFPEFFSGRVTIDAPTNVDDGPHGLVVPKGYALEQNYPNPFNPTTTIEFSLERRAFVNLSVFNILGQPVKTLVDKTLDRGVHRVDFDAESLPSGAYFYRLIHPEGTETRKMMLLK